MLTPEQRHTIADVDRMCLEECERTAGQKAFAAELRKWWRFDSHQNHTHSWHDREDFIDKKLPELLNKPPWPAPSACEKCEYILNVSGTCPNPDCEHRKAEPC